MKSTYAVAVAAAAVLAMVACGTSEPAGSLVREHHAVERGGASRARVEIEMTAGELAVQPGAMMLFEGDFDFNVPALKPVISYAIDESTGALRVSQGFVSGNYENSWRLRLDETTPIDLRLSLGAGDAELVLGRLNLQSLAVRLGAGDFVLDLRGAPAKSYSVTVEAGAGDTTIRLPVSVGISARSTGFIGDTNVSGLERRDGRWINPRAEGSAVTIDLAVRHSIGDLKILAE